MLQAPLTDPTALYPYIMMNPGVISAAYQAAYQAALAVAQKYPTFSTANDAVGPSSSMAGLPGSAGASSSSSAGGGIGSSSMAAAAAAASAAAAGPSSSASDNAQTAAAGGSIGVGMVPGLASTSGASAAPVLPLAPVFTPAIALYYPAVQQVIYRACLACSWCSICPTSVFSRRANDIAIMYYL
jgi:hypothetical protein